MDEIVIEDDNELKPLITVKEAAEFLGISETEVWIIINSEANTYVSSSGLMEWLINPVNEVKSYK
ncbi:MAG: helix-turn-helix domain-containing protein [Firmicutes bacterium]|nr:helix-turn-helix domain-containing protein [Bacillota bacterium]